MNKSVLALLAITTALVAPLAQAQQTQLTRTLLLTKLAALKGITLTETALKNPKLLATSANALWLSPDILAALVAAGDKPISPALATAAVLEAVTGKPVSLAQAAALIAANPSLAVISLEGAQKLVENPGAANKLVGQAQQAVTPTGK